MAGALRISVQAQGLKEIQAKLRGNTLYAEPWKAAMEEFGAAAESLARGAAPRKSGRLASSITHLVQATPVPLLVRVKTTARAEGTSHRRVTLITVRQSTSGKFTARTRATWPNYAYPARLEFDKRSSHQHWMRNAFKGAQVQLTSALERAASAIEARWRC